MFDASPKVAFYCRSKAMLVKQNYKVNNVTRIHIVEVVGRQVSLLGSVSLSLVGSLQVSFPIGVCLASCHHNNNYDRLYSYVAKPQLCKLDAIRDSENSWKM